MGQEQSLILVAGGKRNRSWELRNDAAKKKRRGVYTQKWKPGIDDGVLTPCVPCRIGDVDQACRFNSEDECNRWRSRPPVHPRRDSRNILRMILENNRHHLVNLEGVVNYNHPHNRDLLLPEISNNPMLLQRLNNQLQADPEVVMLAVTKNGLALQYASPNLQNDDNIVLKAVSQNGNALQYASVDLKNDYNIVLRAVSQNGRALQYASGELRDNIVIVTEAIKQDFEPAFRGASRRLQDLMIRQMRQMDNSTS